MTQKQIAIVGISLRFPGATTVDEFWQNLIAGTESVERYGEEQLKEFGIHPNSYRNEQFVRAAAPIKNIDQFDHNFFNYSPKDAALLDPQQRLLLECGYEALEDAGLPIGSKSHDVGVFAGAYVSNYLLRNLGPMISERSKGEDNVPLLYQCETDHLATNLAYRLNLTGPSISTQSWCTTAFSALYLASRAINNGDCKTAMVGAANVIVPQEGYFAPEGGLWSMTGKTRSFDKDGDGCVSGSGVAVVVLKELEEAIKDRNQIYALLRGVSVNNDGKSSAKLGYHGATVEGQYQAITKTLKQAEVSTEQVTYLEANGLATPLADRMELKALSKAFEGSNEQHQPWLGSIKPNIGHLLSASGMAALIKSCLICKYRKIPPLINHEKFTKVNQRMVDPNFRINHQAVDLTTHQTPIICGMNSFGIGGSNAHAIVEEAPGYPTEKESIPAPAQLITWSGISESAVKKIGEDLQQLTENQDLSPSDLSFSLNTGKSQLTVRQAALLKKDQTLEIGRLPALSISEKRETVWIFTGYGETFELQKLKNLYHHEPVFKAWLDRFFNHAALHHGQDFRAFFFQTTKDDQSPDFEFKNNILTIILNYAYAKLLMDWGIHPSKLVGISNGEFTAACLAGVFTFEEMIDVIIRQSEVIATLPTGKMITVIADEVTIQPWMEQHNLDLAGTYLANALVVAGSVENCDAFCHKLDQQGIDYLPIEASFAFHSSEVDPILDRVKSLYESIQFGSPAVPLISTVTGREVKDEIMDPGYWSDKMRAPVRFVEAMSQINPETTLFMEFGPGDKYSSVLKYVYDEEAIVSYPLITAKTTDAYESLLRLLGHLWQHGVEVDWQQFHALKPGKKISTPHYPFERQSFWLDYSKEQPVERIESSKATTTQKEPFENWFYTPAWKQVITPLQPSSTESTATWLVFSSGSEYQKGLINWLRDQNQQVIRVTTGNDFHLTGHELTANPYLKGGLQPLFQFLSENSIKPDQVLYFWGHQTEADRSNYKTLVYDTVIELVKGLNKIKAGKTWNLLVGTRNLFKVHRKDELVTEKSLILGPARTIPQEFPNITCQLIDLDEGLPYEELANLPNGNQSKVLAERQGTLFEQYLAPIPSNEKVIASGFSSSGTYVLTGGTGGIGKAISRYLLDQYPGITLILTGRTEPSIVQSNEAYIALESLAQKTSGKLTYEQLELSEEEQVTHWAEKVKNEYPNLKGILHLAGIQGGGMISFKEPTANESSFEAKITGTDSLIAAFKSHPLDFFVMSSSSAALFGFFGLADYSSANSYMDQLAQLKDGKNTRYISINWDMWAVEGMGSGTGLGAALEALRKKNKAFAINAEQGVKALEQILTWKLPQVAVLTRTPATIASDSNLKPETLQEPSNENETLATSSEETLEASIVRTWERIFERSDISIDSNFFQLGGHSLSGVMFVNKMKNRFPNLELTLHEIFDFPTPKKIAHLIEERIATKKSTKTLKETLWPLESGERKTLLHDFLKQEIESFVEKDNLDSIPISSESEVANHFYFLLKNELELPLYAYEIAERTDFQNLATYIAREFEVFHGLNPDFTMNGQEVKVVSRPGKWKSNGAKPIEDTVFICSAPRSGSTLLRLMLSANSRLFAPPELWLLGYQDMQEWAQSVPEHVIQHGGVSGILKSYGRLTELETKQQVEQYIAKQTSCFEVFQHLRSLAAEKIFIDKTPNYYKDPNVFDRIESGFKQAKYIHLIRHPYATMDSIMKNRIYSLYPSFRNNPIKAAEHIWYTHNQHIHQFMNETNSDRTLIVHFEELVTQPMAVMKRICDFLGVPFDQKMVHPYAAGNLIAGDGDPNILNHDEIDPALAEVWKQIDFQPDLTEDSINLALKYQYPLSSGSDRRNENEKDLVGSLEEEDLDDLLNQLA